MTKWILLFALATILLMPGCASTDTKAAAIDDVVLVNGGAGTTGTINDITPAPVPEENRDLQPQVPRVKQAQVIGVVRALVNSGCAVKKVAATDGIHYSQLIVTCGDVQQAPAVE